MHKYRFESGPRSANNVADLHWQLAFNPPASPRPGKQLCSDQTVVQRSNERHTGPLPHNPRHDSQGQPGAGDDEQRHAEKVFHVVVSFW